MVPPLLMLVIICCILVYLVIAALVAAQFQRHHPKLEGEVVVLSGIFWPFLLLGFLLFRVLLQPIFEWLMKPRA